ncbi:MAG: 3',5'-cyclic-nucleotide phosphodiesterase [Chloroflexi bacterium]|nr:3',5'-cyclic-nucleotide phosphodiesterase [Chloroflexota bacterium]
MEARVLGAHSRETRDTRAMALLIDGVLALDAGGLTGALTLKEQLGIRAMLLTHRHFDHVRDLLYLALNTFHSGESLEVFAPPDTVAHLRTHLLDGALFPDFTVRPSPENPRVQLHPAMPYTPFTLLGYTVTPVPMSHGVPATGWLVAPHGGRSLLYTGDCGPGLEAAWDYVAPDFLLVECTFPDRMGDLAAETHHLTPGLLQQALAALAARRGKLPTVVAVHMVPQLVREIARELRKVAQTLGADISIATEGMRVEV